MKAVFMFLVIRYPHVDTTENYQSSDINRGCMNVLTVNQRPAVANITTNPHLVTHARRSDSAENVPPLSLPGFQLFFFPTASPRLILLPLRNPTHHGYASYSHDKFRGLRPGPECMNGALDTMKATLSCV